MLSVLALAVAAVSAAAVLVRLAEGAHPVAVAFWRCAAVAVLLLPWARPVAWRDAVLVFVAGGFLAAHFALWFTSLDHTSVMRSTVLVTLAPVWIGLLEAGWLHDPPPRRLWLGLAVAIPGVALMSGAAGLGAGCVEGAGLVCFEGDALALLGGVFTALYTLVGQAVRRRVGIGAFGFLLCLSATCWLGAWSVVLDVPLAGYPASTWWVLAAMAVGPQLLGHMGLNWAVRYQRASFVWSLVLLEPVGATLLGVAVLGEVPGALAAAGAGACVLGVLVATTGRASAAEQPSG